MITDYSKTTTGGLLGHWMRRGLHVSMLAFPFIYYYWGTAIAGVFDVTRETLVLILLGAIVVFELVRLSRRLVLFGQREHEAAHISSFAWAAVGVAMVLLFAPGKAFAVPIIASCALIDPLMGEFRRAEFPKWIVFCVGLGAVFVVWVVSGCAYSVPVVFAFLMAPITVLAEWPNIRWVDDNFLMQAVPLAVLLAIQLL